MKRFGLMMVALCVSFVGLGCSKKSSSASYELDGETVIVEETCPKKGGGYDYVACGSIVREKTKTSICGAKGKGTHKYLYRVGAGKPTETSVLCKDG
jgi:hypothetical protein